MNPYIRPRLSVGGLATHPIHRHRKLTIRLAAAEFSDDVDRTGGDHQNNGRFLFSLHVALCDVSGGIEARDFGGEARICGANRRAA